MTNKLEQIAQELGKKHWKRDQWNNEYFDLTGYTNELLAKLAEGVEPVAYAVLDGREIDSSGWEFIASWPEACHEHINDAINVHEIEDAALWRVVSLYTAEALASVQQKTAEACATLAGVCGLGKEAAAAIRSNVWREFQ